MMVFKRAAINFHVVPDGWSSERGGFFRSWVLECSDSWSRVYERAAMSHVLAYDGHYFRVEIAEVVTEGEPEQGAYVSWCSDAFKELKDAPSQSLSRFVAGPPLPTYAEARRHASDWIRVNRDALKAKQASKVRDLVGTIYTVWLFKGESLLDLRVRGIPRGQGVCQSGREKR